MGVPGPWELLIILAIVMVLFGTSKLTGIGKSLGGAIRDFRSSVKSETPKEEPEEPAEDESKETGNSND